MLSTLNMYDFMKSVAQMKDFVYSSVFGAGKEFRRGFCPKHILADFLLRLPARIALTEWASALRLSIGSYDSRISISTRLC